ncbi:MAG: (d)CMP kinase [Bacteroidota bacterium]
MKDSEHTTSPPSSSLYLSKKIIIAIDGYSACGKSTTAKLVASQLGYTYIDTGAMYRAVTLYFHNHYIALDSPKEVQTALNHINIHLAFNPKTDQSETFLNGLNVEKEIRKMYISEKVSEVSALADVRKAMVKQQQEMGKKKGLVMDGRDIGTKVFPEAELKVFMSADLHIRAARRQLELLERKELVNLQDIIENLDMRDRIDTTRKESPLMKAEDAFEIDTSFLTIEEQVEYIINLATSKIILLSDHRLTE